MLNKLWEALLRWRNWVVTAIGSAMLLLPDLLAAPELLAVLPPQYHKWVFFGTLLLNLAIRWRPAVLKDDPEAEITRLRKGLAK